jgi:hypothetical protein
MTLAELADANSWDKDDRAQAGKNLYNLKTSGELLAEVAEGKVHYRLNPAFERFKKTRGKEAPPVVVKTPTPPPPKADDDPPARRVAKETLAKIVENVKGDGVTVVSVPMSKPALDLLDTLVERGLHGFSRGDAAQRLVYRALESLL